ncbi:MAG: hypothetical protein KC656_07780, partial [Myxococcales bacterium]|nr:hypothetical protein [Myxococcales bacterium]
MLTPDDHTLLLGCAARPVEPEEGEGIAMALVEQAFPWAGILDPLVLAEDAGGDFVALVRAGPIAGHVVVFRHDDAPDVLARSLADWLDGVRATGELTGAHLDPRGERTQREELGAQHLVANAWGEDDWTALALAVPLIRDNVGLLAQLATAEGVGELAEARLRQ